MGSVISKYVSDLGAVPPSSRPREHLPEMSSVRLLSLAVSGVAVLVNLIRQVHSAGSLAGPSQVARPGPGHRRRAKGLRIFP